MKIRNKCAGDRQGSRSTWLRAGSSAVAIGCFMLSSAVYAQDADDSDPDEATTENTIIVSGIRASLESSQNIKRDADTVVDAITAEDIGALPDRSVTEALQRVPGVSINRFAGSNDPDHFSVEGSGVVIRGLNFVRSEFNGRDAFVAGVNGQAINFADIPAELLGSVIINKNSTADMIEGGLAGTVNLNTRLPFDDYGFNAGFSLEANYGDFREEWTPSISGLVSNTWDTGGGTFGLLLSGSYSQIKSRADGIQIANYQTRDGASVRQANALENFVCRNRLPNGSDTLTLPAPNTCGADQLAGADGFSDLADLRYAPVGGQFRTQDFNRERDGIAAAAQWESDDRRTTLTAQFIRAHTTNAWGERTFESAPDNAEYNTYPVGCFLSPAAGGQAANEGEIQCGPDFVNYQYDETNLFQSGYITSPASGWRGGGPGGASSTGFNFVPYGGVQQTLSRRQVDEETTNYDYGLNLQHRFSDRLSVELDAQYATSRRTNADISVFGSTFADQEIDLSGDLPVIVPHKPNVTAYTWAGTNPNLDPLSDEQYFRSDQVQFWRAAMDHFEESDGEQVAFSADVAYEFDDGAFLREARVGGRYSDRDQTIRYTTYNWGVLSEVWAGDSPVPLADTNPFLYEFYDFPDFFRGEVPGPIGGYYWGGDLIGQYDSAASQFQAINQQWQDRGGQTGWVPAAARSDAVDGSPFRPDEISDISQTDYALYGMLRFDTTDVWDSGPRIGGNIGLRWVRSEVSSASATRVPTAAEINIGDDFATRCSADLPDNAPPGTEVQVPGGVCALGEAGYAQLQAFTGNTATIVPRETETAYDYFLPSLNLRAEVADDVIVRAAASRVLTRPQTSYIRNYLTFDTSQGTLLLSAGNPDLRPATAWQFDLTAEWYFAPVGSLTINGFYKFVDGFFFSSPEAFEITNNGVTLDTEILAPANFDGTGEIRGVEIAYQQTYDFLPGPLSGLGMNANYTYIESSGLPNAFLNTGEPVDTSTIEPGNLPLEGLSRHNVNVAVFYEQHGISARAAYNWRSRFLLTVADVIYPYTSIFNEATGQLDASLFYNLTDNIKIGVQGVNLTNEVTRTSQAYTGDPDVLAPRSYFMNDRRFSFVIRGTF
ncbi:TonB-dependent receptor [Aurantiacibacter sp. MUD61]|uniref:TonB-dependent receptor n=1 Tax=Aurantiacibacter sp. MUD61 TaxID=3009083 RepID=UPI0022F111B7|nr:TonB-dependent receptor [Aurantiacibacter sp. MUD61]